MLTARCEILETFRIVQSIPAAGPCCLWWTAWRPRWQLSKRQLWLEWRISLLFEDWCVWRQEKGWQYHLFMRINNGILLFSIASWKKWCIVPEKSCACNDSKIQSGRLSRKESITWESVSNLCPLSIQTGALVSTKTEVNWACWTLVCTFTNSYVRLRADTDLHMHACSYPARYPWAAQGNSYNRLIVSLDRGRDPISAQNLLNFFQLLASLNFNW